MDISQTTEPKSDQQNFDDYAAAPKTVTVEKVTEGSPEQPVEIHLVEFPGRPYKPAKSMRRVLVACWGPDSTAYAGRRMTLFGDPSVRFGGAEVGGIRIKALSHIFEEKAIKLTVTRGRRTPFIVKPLPTDTSEQRAALEAASTLDELQIAWRAAAKAGVVGDPALVKVKDAQKAKLTKAGAE